MQRIKEYFKKKKQDSTKNKERDAKLTVLEEIFNDLYNDRKRIYKLNFIRGLLFGLGSAIGGTIAVALIVWILSLFVNAPFVGQLFENTQQAINQTSEESSRKPRD